MEQLNKVELRGIVGNVSSNLVADKHHTRFQVATNLAYKDKQGNAVVETTWLSVSAFSDEPSELKCGDKVYVLGRLRNNRYIDTYGVERCSTEVVANKVTMIKE